MPVSPENIEVKITISRIEYAKAKEIAKKLGISFSQIGAIALRKEMHRIITEKNFNL